MNNKIDKIKYLNNAIYQKDKYVYSGPRFLYKYRPFDQYAFSMLEKETLYLCPASELDDETECDTSIDVSDIYEFETNNLKRICLEQIIQMLKPYCEKGKFEEIRNKIYEITMHNGVVRNNFLVDMAHEIQAAAPGIDTAPFVNWIIGIPRKLDDPEIKPQLEKLIGFALNAKSTTGICSLSENNDIEYMWEHYADNGSGYCIEYDMDGYENGKNVLPVIYDANRETSIVMALVANFIGLLITGFSNNRVQADASQYLRLFISKYPEWEYQNEWRVLGEAGTLYKAPKINSITIGKNVDKDNEDRIIAFCNAHNITYLKQK